MQEKHILFICLGNICRSPMAEAIFRHKLQQSQQAQLYHVRSAAISRYHIGEPPDIRAQDEARRQGIKGMEKQRAQRVSANDFTHTDYLITMDNHIHTAIEEECPPAEQHRLYRMLDFAPHLNMTEVPDPYYGTVEDFHRMFLILNVACDGLCTYLNIKN